MLTPVPFAIATNVGRSTPATSERVVNLIPVANPPGSKTPYTLLGAPGLVEWQSVGIGPIRGMRTMGTFLYVVSGPELYRLDQSGTQTYIGLIDGTQPVTMADNGYQLSIVADSLTYVVTGTTLTTVSAVDARSVTVQDGYAIYVTRNTGEFVISEIADSGDVDPAEFASAESNPDNLLTVVSANRELWLMGERSIEVWYNSGDPEFPFVRNAAGVINRGALSPWSVVVIDGQVYWLGDDGLVYRNAGYVPQRISTHAIDYAIGQFDYGQQRAAVASTYSQEGHTFYVLTFQNGTYVFDISTGLWHERQTYGQTRWRVSCMLPAFGELLAGDFADGKIYHVDLDTYVDDDQPIQRIVDTQPIGDGINRILMHSFQLSTEAGTGLIGGQGADPEVILQWSDNGGRTWRNEHHRPLGPIGAYAYRTIWRRLGMFRQRSMRIIISDPIKIAIYGAYAELSQAGG